MNRLFHTCKQLIGVAALSVGLYACDWIHDDSLPLCEFRLYFKYDYNMKFAEFRNIIQEKLRHGTRGCSYHMAMTQN